MICRGSYGDFADEYYDAARHPTSANFRAASALVLDRWRDVILRQTGWTCEIGAGQSLTADRLESIRPSLLPSLLLIDLSQAMLKFSTRWVRDGRGVKLVVADATCIPLASNSVESVISLLGDAYNANAFWREVERITMPGGNVVFTSPSYEWSSRFREHTDGGADTAVFALADGSSLAVPSFISPIGEQVKMLESAGLVVKETIEVSLGQLNGQGLSPKLTNFLSAQDPVITGYLAMKAL
jgi:SAM-dependent methyltransferase